MCECVTVSVSERVCISSAWLQQAWLTNAALEAPRTVVPRTLRERLYGALLDEPAVGAQGCRCEPGPAGGFVLNGAKPCLTGTSYRGGGLLCLKPRLGKWGVAASWRGGFPRGPQPAPPHLYPGGRGQPGSLSIEQFQGKAPEQSRDHLAFSQRDSPVGEVGDPPPTPNAGVSDMESHLTWGAIYSW